MAITITRPNTFAATANPIIYRFTRKDFTFNQVNNAGGAVQLQFNSVDLTTSFVAGDTVYVKSNNGVYNGFGEVTASTFGANTLVTLDIAYVSAAPGGYVNNHTLRKSYKLEVEIWLDTVQLIDVPFYYTPDVSGNIVSDVSKILETLLNPDIQYISQSLATEANIVSYNIRYREIWQGSAESQTNDSANTRHAILAAVQIGSSNIVDSNNALILDRSNTMYYNQRNYVSFLSVAADACVTYSTTEYDLHNSVALDLLSGTSVVLAEIPYSSLKVTWANRQIGADVSWGTITQDTALVSLDVAQVTNIIYVPCVGKSSTTIPISFTYNCSNLRSSPTTLRVYTLDIDGAIISTVQTIPITGSASSSVNGTFTGEIAITSAVRGIGFTFQTGGSIGGAGNQFCSVGSLSLNFSNVNTFQVFLSGIPDSEPISISKLSSSPDLRFTKTDVCDNDFTLLWRNSLGGVESYIFKFNQEMEYTNEDGRRFKEYLLYANNLSLTDWERLNELNYPKESYKVNIIEQLATTLKTDLVDNQQVYQLIDNLSTGRRGVIVIPQSNSTETKRSRHEIFIRVRLPEYYMP